MNEHPNRARKPSQCTGMTIHHRHAQPLGLPAGQRYFTAAQVATPGDLYTLERLPKFTRNAAVRQVQEYVLPF